MNSPLLQALEDWLSRGGERLGQILIRDNALMHHEDFGREDLHVYDDPEAARQIALYDDGGNYRPLKTAPNLRHGWKLSFKDMGELRLALDYFYPAMVGLWFQWQQNNLRAVNLRETVNRQTGMYAVTRHITNTDADTLIGGACKSDGGCLRKILWKIEEQAPITSLPAEKFDPLQAPPNTMPLLCSEACNLLVAAARPVVKKAYAEAQARAQAEAQQQ